MVVFEAEGRPWGRNDFLNYFEAFLLAHPELPATRFGALACADPGFMYRLRKGKVSFSMRNFERVVNFIQTYDPVNNPPLLHKRSVP